MAFIEGRVQNTPNDPDKTPEGSNMSHQLSHATKLVALITCVAFLQGCTSTARLNTTTAGTTLAIKGVDRKELPRTEELGSKATGQYEFMAVPPQGEPLYGILPLKVNGGKIVASIMFFAPALFIGGFRDVYGFYEIDPGAKTIRFKNTEADDWHMYQPTVGESQRAKTYFEALAAGCVTTSPSGPAITCAPSEARAPK
jgi:hypothetical protein